MSRPVIGSAIGINSRPVPRSCREAFGSDFEREARTDAIVGWGLAVAYTVVAAMFAIGWI